MVKNEKLDFGDDIEHQNEARGDIMAKSSESVVQIVGVFLCIVGFVFALIAYQGVRMARLKREGVVTQATVLNKYTLRSTKVTNTGTRYDDDFLIDISFSSQDGLVFATLDVISSIWKKAQKGAKIQVIYLPQDPQNSVLASEQVQKGAANPYIFGGLALAFFVAGLVMFRIG